MKYYTDEENYLWRMEDDVWEIYDDDLGWDEWKEGKEVEPIENFEFIEITKAKAEKQYKMVLTAEED